VVFLNALSGTLAYGHMHRIDYRAGVLFGAATVPGAVLGAYATSLLSRQLFDLFFSILVLTLATFILLRPTPSPRAARERVLLEAETERLATLRQRMVEQLGQVYAPLGLTLVDTRQELEPSNHGALEAPTGQLSAPPTASQQGQLEDHQPDDQENTSGS
jgi:hypothetical protein